MTRQCQFILPELPVSNTWYFLWILHILCNEPNERKKKDWLLACHISFSWAIFCQLPVHVVGKTGMIFRSRKLSIPACHHILVKPYSNIYRQVCCCFSRMSSESSVGSVSSLYGGANSISDGIFRQGEVISVKRVRVTQGGVGIWAGGLTVADLGWMPWFQGIIIWVSATHSFKSTSSAGE